ncbi:MAG: VWA domain-containing protein [Bacteroidetes bacterium]|nr:VWA domain-containing protein [Bacteroidota bacterium]
MKKLIIILAILLDSFCVFADGIILPKDTLYPHPFLKNLLTEVTVNIHGQMVETIVYQEFYNEWSDTVDGVWNFPMPADARSTRLTYWKNDTAYDAVLKVVQQVVNPGTGEGGIAAYVNQYIGKSGIKLELKRIPPHSVQKICFHYFSLLDYNKGEYSYTYPLNTSSFIQYYLSYLKVNINIDSKSVITNYDFPNYNSYTQVLSSSSNHLSLEMLKDKAYLAEDFTFKYKIEQSALNVDFYSNYCDTIPSHFGIFVKPPLYEIPSKILAKRIIFLLGNSSSMNGYKLQQSLSAISDALDSLKPMDVFNILLYNSAVTSFNSNFVYADTGNIHSAKTFLQSVIASGGSDLNLGLNNSLAMITDTSYQNCILGFSDGHSVIDPLAISASNNNRTAICFIGIGSNIDRERLEMTASNNYGFVTYVDANDNIKEKIMSVFNKINAPIIKNVNLNFNKSDVGFLVPTPFPTINAGSSFYVAGRYSSSTQNPLNLHGYGVLGYVGSTFILPYSNDSISEFYVRYLWAKAKMDDLERRILIYGEDSVLVDSLIYISLSYKMRCRYTAYITMEEALSEPPTLGINNTPVSNDNRNVIVMPNPFKEIMNLSITVPSTDQKRTKLLKIFSSTGALLRVIDISEFFAGKHVIQIDFSSMPSGIYYVIYQDENSIVQSFKAIHL